MSEIYPCLCFRNSKLCAIQILLNWSSLFSGQLSCNTIAFRHLLQSTSWVNMSCVCLVGLLGKSENTEFESDSWLTCEQGFEVKQRFLCLLFT